MFRKVSLKIVLILFLGILVIAAIVEFVDIKNGDRTFREDLIEVNPNDVTEIQLYPKMLGRELIKFYKENGKWVIENSGRKFRANETLPLAIINELNEAIPESVVATKKEQWKQFEITDSLATRIKLLSNSKVLCDLYFGKCSVDQSRKATSFVRLAGDKEVYGIPGYLSLGLNRDAYTFRDQTIIKKGSSDWTKLTFTCPSDSSFTLSKVGGKWFMGATPVDSVKVASYFSSISNLTNSNFVEPAPAGLPSHSLLIEGNNLEAPVKIDGYRLPDGNMVICSSQNPGANFKTTGVEAKIFISRKALLK
jgi:hypothetical protein